MRGEREFFNFERERERESVCVCVFWYGRLKNKK